MWGCGRVECEARTRCQLTAALAHFHFSIFLPFLPFQCHNFPRNPLFPFPSAKLVLNYRGLCTSWPWCTKCRIQRLLRWPSWAILQRLVDTLSIWFILSLTLTAEISCGSDMCRSYWYCTGMFKLRQGLLAGSATNSVWPWNKTYNLHLLCLCAKSGKLDIDLCSNHLE
jgi:hypothetical protein